MTFVLGLMLFQNEEIFLERAASNIAAFCDQVILMDNASTDDSPAIAARLVERFPHFSVMSVTSPTVTHRMISHLAGTPTWVFGVDADEIYDPGGLARLRQRLEAGEFDRFFEVKGHSFHCRGITFGQTKVALGHPSPASRPVTKLYNFGALHRWDNPAERLHGRARVFRRGYGGKSVLKLMEQDALEDTDFRCLHVCFLPRSRKEVNAPIEYARLNPWERKRKPDSEKPADYKRSYYMNGPAEEIDIGAFFPPLLTRRECPEVAERRRARLPPPGMKGPEQKLFWRDARDHFGVMTYSIVLLDVAILPKERVLISVEVSIPADAPGIDVAWRGFDMIQAILGSHAGQPDTSPLVARLQLSPDRLMPGESYRFDFALESAERSPGASFVDLHLGSPVMPSLAGPGLRIDLPEMPAPQPGGLVSPADDSDDD